MPKIHLLPETVINQIAAGEVVDRPASIVKELIENSVDAQAKHIVVKFNDGGDTFLSIADDGVGMDAKDAPLAFERNATSKLEVIKDLESLGTFGFRGEAIASISSVARVTMQTNDGSGGTEIHYDSGKKIYQKACSSSQGTLIEIRNLFEKIPARKRFLKSATTEAMHIIRVVRAFILAKPEINFELYRNGKLLFSSPDSRDLQERVELLFGHFDQYTPLDYAHDRVRLHGVLFEHAVDGLVSKPDFLIFVNGRNVNHPAIVRVVRDAYGMIRSRVTSMGAILFLEFHGHFVDFNVHPQKKEVRFKNEFFVQKFVVDSVSDALRRKIESLRFCGNDENNAPMPTIYAESLTRDVHFFKAQRKMSVPYTVVSGLGDDSEVPRKEDPGPEDERYVPPPRQVFELTLGQALDHFPRESIANNPCPWRFVGTFDERRFAIFEIETGLAFVDLAAAQKCILWDKFLCNPDRLIPQCLLIPRVVTVSSEQSLAMDALSKKLALWGIEIENFGKNIYKITALPREISEETVLQCLQDPSLPQDDERLTREALAKKICAHLKFHPLEDEEVKALIFELLHCRQFTISPDNTNVLFTMDHRDVEKKFGLQFTPRVYCH
ncbi:MAG: DNA mismatch repair endonuclease MutL [Puniceicoccales bacterium]|jgi:DNA mismatch repair protein MutL|nr:DNA mismatch repair endonuclease MutL [Puniceicoccales bacterium]